MLYEVLKLYVYPDAFVFEPLSATTAAPRGKSNAPKLILQRATGVASTGNTQDAYPGKAEKIITCHGILGTIRLLSGNYLIVITDRQWVGCLDGHDIYTIKDTQLFRYARSDAHLTPRQKADEEVYVRLLKAALAFPSYYFSFTYNLTQSIQRESTIPVRSDQPLWERSKDRFFWNRHLQRDLIELAQKSPEAGAYIMPVIFGFLEIRHVEINKASFDFALISRRSRHRVGTRFFRRGVDVEGNVANQVETEQIVVLHDMNKSGLRRRMSFIQTRGSIPVYWAQVCTLKYTPTLHLDTKQDSLSAARKHFNDQIALYGPQIVVNLVNKHGYEKPMSDVFRSTMAELNDPSIRYIHFDFHKECSRMRWDRIRLLLNDIKDDVEKQGYFEQTLNTDGSVNVTRKQSSVVRTNCMDCLDRTNVVQSAVARDVLVRQLASVGVLGPNEMIQNYPVFELIFRNIWADNANAISVAYSGTGALKTDFTRTGKRTKAGALQDLSNSIVRYVKNNFMDGARQDAYDILLGEYEIDSTRMSPLLVKVTAIGQAVPWVLLASMVVIFLSFILSSADSFFSFVFLLWCTLWFGLLGACISLVLEHADQFVDWPRLVAYPYRAVSKKTFDTKTGRHGTTTAIEQVAPVSTESNKKTV
ncbi:SacI homology domain-containing protein [Syncephalis fuscata]|nr:SacI homology domain-containing protein [Syncephalis fuscata]